METVAAWISDKLDESRLTGRVGVPTNAVQQRPAPRRGVPEPAAQASAITSLQGSRGAEGAAVAGAWPFGLAAAASGPGAPHDAGSAQLGGLY